MHCSVAQAPPPPPGRHAEWREDLKALYHTAGVAGRRVAFLLDEPQIKAEAFLDDVNNMLTSGEVPNLWTKVCARARGAGGRGWQGGVAPRRRERRRHMVFAAAAHAGTRAPQHPCAPRRRSSRRCLMSCAPRPRRRACPRPPTA